MISKSVNLDYKKLFEYMPSLDVVMAADLTVLDVSEAYLQATMNRREDMVGRTMFDVFPDNPDDETSTGVRNLHESLQRVLKNKVGDAMAVQRYDISKPGGGFEERHWSPYNSPILDEQGNIQYILHRAVDVTEFMKLKQKDKKISIDGEEVEVEIYQRAQEVAEANRKLHAIDEIKTNFFANISHELRTPLTLILGPVTSLLSSNTLAADMQHSLRVVERNAQLLLKQVNDLLDIAKLEAGKHSIDYSRVDIVRLVRDLATGFDVLAKDRNIDFILEMPTSVTVELDIAKIQRILLNLLSNAFKFTPQNGQIKVTLEEKEQQIKLCVMDSGIGIPEAERQAVFERFHQIDGSARRAVGGTGLGLTIVKEFTELHRGSITVDQAVIGGAQFTVRLPIKAPENVIVVTEENSLNKDNNMAILTELNHQYSVSTVANSSHLQGGLVLIVEDNPDMRGYITELMSDYRIEIATNGQEGLEQATQLLPDLIISDMMMPKMSGDEMVRALLLQPQTKDIPMLMVTAKSDDMMKLNLIKEGINDYITKPFSPEELRLKAGNLIAKRRQVIAEHETLITQLTQSNRDLEHFAYAAAHDMQTPLRSIDNLSQWIEEDSGEHLQGKSLEHLKRLRHQVRSMERLLNDMLEYARIDKKQHIDDKGVVKGSELIDTIIVLISPPKEFMIQCSETFGELLVYKMPLQKILYNLIVNAIKHHDKSSGIVQVSVEDNDLYLKINVCDDGPGIAPQYHQKIFDMFQTLKPKSQTDGNGMGLAIVKKIITLQGGDIEVASQEGHGACFSFTWPKLSIKEEDENAKRQYA